MIKTSRLVTESDLSTDLKEARESIKQIRRGRTPCRSGEQVQQRPRDGEGLARLRNRKEAVVPGINEEERKSEREQEARSGRALTTTARM